VQLVSASGAVTATYDYDAFGNIAGLAPNTSDSNPFRYCGEYFDAETGTYYLRARYYNPATGRFLTEDPYRGDPNDPLSLNLYTYCANNPIRYVDPSGNSWKDTLHGMVEVLDDSLTDGTAKWLVHKLTGYSVNYIYECEHDYYLGRVIGGGLSVVIGAGVSAAGVAKIVGSIVVGGSISAGTGGILLVAGVAISVAGVTAGAVEVTVGGVIVAAAINNLSNDISKMNNAQRGVGGKGWHGDSTWKGNVKTVKNGGTIESLNGGIPTEAEAKQLIDEAGGKVVRVQPAHPEGGISTHTYNHINYTTASGARATIRIK